MNISPEHKAFQLCKNGAEHGLKEVRQIINISDYLSQDVEYWKKVEKIIEDEFKRDELKRRNSPAASRLFG
jgi:hypothetical protein